MQNVKNNWNLIEYNRHVQILDKVHTHSKVRRIQFQIWIKHKVKPQLIKHYHSFHVKRMQSNFKKTNQSKSFSHRSCDDWLAQNLNKPELFMTMTVLFDQGSEYINQHTAPSQASAWLRTPPGSSQLHVLNRRV